MDNQLMTKNTPAIEVEIPGFQVLGFTKIYGSDDISVTVCFENPRLGLKKTVTLSMSEVQSARAFRKRIPPSFAIPDVKPSHQIETLCYAINQALNRPDMRVGEALPQGFSLVTDRLFYVIGDFVLPREKYSEKQFEHLIADNPYQIKLCTDHSPDKKVTMENMFHWICTFCEQGPAQAALFLCALTPYMKYVLPTVASLGSVVHAYIVGESGVGKSAQAELISGITETGYGINLESDMAQILLLLSRSPDRAILIDDLNRTVSARQKAEKEDKLSKLIQMTFSAGNISSREIEVDLSNNALLISGEYALSNPSSINRCVTLRIQESFDSNILTYLQQEKGLYTLFVLEFISFLCRYDKKIKTELEKFCNEESFHISNAGSESEYFGFSRIYRHNKILRATAYAVTIFLANILSDSKEYHRFYCVLTDGVGHCISDTLKEVSKKPISDVAIAFLEMFKEDKLIAKNPEKYFEKNERLFFLYKEYLYFKGERLARYLSEVLQRSITSKIISRELGEVNLLSKYGNSYSENLPPDLNKKYPGQGHFYRADVNFLTEMLRDYYGPIVYMSFQLHRLLTGEKDKKKNEKKKKGVIINETMYFDTD
jgi:hypothetical protein